MFNDNLLASRVTPGQVPITAPAGTGVDRQQQPLREEHLFLSDLGGFLTAGVAVLIATALPLRWYEDGWFSCHAYYYRPVWP